MKFILMMHAPRGDGEWALMKQWTPEAFGEHIKFMKDFNRELRERGQLVGCEGLAPPGQARVVRSNEANAPLVTDGPFAEAKEFLAGYWIVAVDNAQEAYEIAARASSAPGPDGKPLHMQIEVREVMSVAPVEV
ncbi:MAG TPA: YciI family protein [Polyangiales bacterium]|nr:YciI family protein [Polyangiales bacterium]